MFTFDLSSLQQHYMFHKRKPLLATNKHKKRKEIYSFIYPLCLLIIFITCTIISIKAITFKKDLNILNRKKLDLLNEQGFQKEKNLQMDLMIERITRDKEDIIKRMNEQKNITDTKQQELDKLKKQIQLRNVIKNDLHNQKYILPPRRFHPLDHWFFGRRFLLPR